MIHPLATTASCKFHWWCLAAYEIKKDREWEEKKLLVKNLSAIDFLPCWSSTYHPTSHRPVFSPSFVVSSMFQVQFFSQVNKEVVWQWGGVLGQGGAWGVARYHCEEGRQPAVWSVLIRWRAMDRSSSPNEIFYKGKYDSQTLKRARKKYHSHWYLQYKDKALENTTVKGRSRRVVFHSWLNWAVEKKGRVLDIIIQPEW